MTKVSDEYLETRRDQILDAAINCFARKGFIETTIEDICKEAKLSHGSVYRYFSNKEDIIGASVRRYREDRARRFAAQQTVTMRQGLEEFIRAFAQRWVSPEPDNNMKVAVQSFGEALRNPRVRKIVGDNLTDAEDRIGVFVRGAQERGEINSDLDPRAIAKLLNAIHDGLLLQKVILPERSGDIEELLKVVRAFLIKGEFWRETKEEQQSGDNSKRTHSLVAGNVAKRLRTSRS